MPVLLLHLHARKSMLATAAVVKVSVVRNNDRVMLGYGVSKEEHAKCARKDF